MVKIYFMSHMIENGFAYAFSAEKFILYLNKKAFNTNEHQNHMMKGFTKRKTN